MDNITNYAASEHGVLVSFYETGGKTDIRSPTDIINAVKTGDAGGSAVLMLILMITAILIILFLYRRKKKKAAIGILMIGFIAISMLLTFSTAIAAGQEGSIEFRGADTPPYPLDPEGLTEFVEEGDHEIVGVNGVYLMMAPDFDFGKNPISAKDELYSVGKMNLRYRDTGQEKMVDNYVEVADERYEGGGWAVTVSLDGQLKNEKGQELTGAEIRISDVLTYDEKRNQNDVTAPGAITLRPGVETRVMTGGKETDAIRYFEVFREVSLYVPGKTQKESGTYTAKLMWGLYDTP